MTIWEQLTHLRLGRHYPPDEIFWDYAWVPHNDHYIYGIFTRFEELLALKLGTIFFSTTESLKID